MPIEAAAIETGMICSAPPTPKRLTTNAVRKNCRTNVIRFSQTAVEVAQKRRQLALIRVGLLGHGIELVLDRDVDDVGQQR